MKKKNMYIIIINVDTFEKTPTERKYGGKKTQPAYASIKSEMKMSTATTMSVDTQTHTHTFEGGC